MACYHFGDDCSHSPETNITDKYSNDEKSRDKICGLLPVSLNFIHDFDKSCNTKSTLFYRLLIFTGKKGVNVNRRRVVKNTLSFSLERKPIL